MKLRISLQPKQAMFWAMVQEGKASWLGYGGSRGGAKSGAARRIMVKRRLDFPGTSGQILRRVWSDVQVNHINKFWEEFPDLLPYYKATEKCIKMPNGSRIFFDSAENLMDVERKAYGPEYMDIMVDQAEQFSENELTQLKTTCRWPGMPLHACKFMLYFNPGGVGAAFLQRVFYTKKYLPRENADDYAFLQAFGWDNVEWVRAALVADGIDPPQFYQWGNQKRFDYYITRSQYGQEQNALPAHKRAGQLLGDFKKFAGQYFSNFTEDVHSIAAEEIDFKPWWPRWVSIDWGFQHHAVALWHCQAAEWMEGDRKRRLIITYKILVKQGLSERALAEEIVSSNDSDKLQNVYGGHDLWKKETRGGSKEKQMSQVFRAAGMPSMKQAKIDRVDGWRFMFTALDECEWIITKDCQELLDAIPTAVFNDKADGGLGNEDVLKTNTKEDDILDCARYGLYTQYAPGKKPEGQVIQDQTSHLSDPTSRAIQIRKLTAIQSRKKSLVGVVNSRGVGRAGRLGRVVAV